MRLLMLLLQAKCRVSGGGCGNSICCRDAGADPRCERRETSARKGPEAAAGGWANRDASRSVSKDPVERQTPQRQQEAGNKRERRFQFSRSAAPPLQVASLSSQHRTLLLLSLSLAHR